MVRVIGSNWKWLPLQFKSLQYTHICLWCVSFPYFYMLDVSRLSNHIILCVYLICSSLCSFILWLQVTVWHHFGEIVGSAWCVPVSLYFIMFSQMKLNNNNNNKKTIKEQNVCLRADLNELKKEHGGICLSDIHRLHLYEIQYGTQWISFNY